MSGDCMYNVVSYDCCNESEILFTSFSKVQIDYVMDLINNSPLENQYTHYTIIETKIDTFPPKFNWLFWLDEQDWSRITEVTIEREGPSSYCEDCKVITAYSYKEALQELSEILDVPMEDIKYGDK